MASKPFEIKIGTPTEFDGDRDNSAGFLLACNSYLDINKTIYVSDKQKIIFITSFMTEGNARLWKEDFLTQAQDPKNKDTAGNIIGYGTLKDFLAAFRKAFKPLDPSGTALARLRAMKQETGDLQSYIADFQMLTHRAGIIGDTALIQFFVDGLQIGLLKRLYSTGDVPNTIEGIIDICVHLDNNFHQLRTIQARLHPQTKKKNYGSHRYSSSRDPNAMEVDRLTEDKKNEHFRTRKCFTCHKTGHRARECPQKKNGKMPVRRKQHEDTEGEDEEINRLAEDF